MNMDAGRHNWEGQMRHIAVIAMLILAAAAQANAQQAILRDGSCPAGYSTSSNYCVPSANAKPAIERNGSCPSGYSTSGNYCLMSDNGHPAIHRVGSCPSGFSTSGNYCLQNR